MAVQANLLGSSDLSRLVAAAQANRPPSLGQLAEARRKERMDSRTKLAEIGLKFAIENRKIDILRQQGADELALKQADYENQKSVRESTLRLAVEEAKTKRTRDKAADRLSAHNQFMQDFIKKTGSEGLAAIEFRNKKEMRGIFNALNMGELGFDFEEDYGSFFEEEDRLEAERQRLKEKEEKRKAELELQKELDARSPGKAGGKKIVQATGADKSFLSTGKLPFNPFIPTEAARRRVYTNNSNL